MRSSRTSRPADKRHLRLGLVGAAFAAVPIYRAFCQATGFGGTVGQAKSAPTHQLNQTLRVSFDTNVRGVPLTFTPEKPDVTVKIGATGMAFFKVTNTSDHPVTARAVYNVVPEQAGAYVRKLQCFCFNAQTLAPHQTVDFPMIFYVDPGFASDRDTKLFTGENQREQASLSTWRSAHGRAIGKQAANRVLWRLGSCAHDLGGRRRNGP
jgi:cytochrome c oxidase assembly protein Cox11